MVRRQLFLAIGALLFNTCCNTGPADNGETVTILAADPEHGAASVVAGNRTFVFRDNWCRCRWDLHLWAKGRPLCGFGRLEIPREFLRDKIRIREKRGRACEPGANDLWQDSKNTVIVNCFQTQDELLFLAVLCALSKKAVEPNSYRFVKQVAALPSQQPAVALAATLLSEWNLPLNSPVFSTTRPLGSIRHHYEVCGTQWKRASESLVVDAYITSKGTVDQVLLVHPGRSDLVNRAATEELRNTVFRPAGTFEDKSGILRFRDSGVFRLTATVDYTGAPCPTRD